MSISHHRISSLSLGSLIGFSLVALPALSAGSQDSKQPVSESSLTESTDSLAGALARTDGNQSNRRPGPAWKTIGGTVKHIKGEIYTVEDYEGNQIQLYVSRETKRLRGQKKVGDRVRAEITRDGFANSIQ